MAATTVVNNSSNSNQPFGTSGIYDNATMQCPAGSYVTSLSGHAGADVNQIENMTCYNVVTRQTSGPLQVNTLGHNGGGNPVAIACNTGNDGLVGFNVATQASNQTGKNVTGLKGICAGFPSGSQYNAGSWGNVNNGWNFPCPTGYNVYQINGGAASSENGYLAGLSYGCKSLGGASTMAGNGVSRGKCIVGDDSSTDCAEIKSILSGQGSKESDVESYCAQGSNILLPNCSAYYNNDPTNVNYQQIMVGPSGYCTAGTNFTTNLCTNFCTATTGNSLPNGKKDVCNTLYEQKCAVPPASNTFPICNSLQPWGSYPGAAELDKIPGAIQDPECYFADVIAHGYKKAPTSSLGCPACVQNQSITLSDSTDSAISDVVQSCNVSNGTSTPTTATPAASTTPLTNSLTSTAAPMTPPPGTTAPAKVLGVSKKTFIIVLVIVIIVICLSSSVGGGLLAVVMRKEK